MKIDPAPSETDYRHQKVKPMCETVSQKTVSKTYTIQGLSKGKWHDVSGESFYAYYEQAMESITELSYILHVDPKSFKHDTPQGTVWDDLRIVKDERVVVE